MKRAKLATAAYVLISSTAFACLGPQFEDHHYPSCTISLPKTGERVSVIYGDGRAKLSDHHLGNPNKRTRIVTVHINKNSSKHYLVLSANEQTIWHLTGDVKSVSRAVVLGATEVGPNGAGVMGLAKDRISFTSPDLSALDSIAQTSCTRVALACTPAQWFDAKLIGRTTFHPNSPQSRQRMDEIVAWHSGPSSHSSGAILLVPPEVEGTVVPISPELVVSPNPVEEYENETGSKSP